MVRLQLLQLLKQSNKIDFETNIEWLTKLKEWINTQCPYLQMYVVKGRSVGWLVIIPSDRKVEELASPDIRVLVNMDKTFQFQVLKSSVTEGEITNFCAEEPIMAILHSFHPESNFTMCEGAKKSSKKCKFWFEKKSTHITQKASSWCFMHRLLSSTMTIVFITA